mmetsp:Transcript_28656/g.81969  ORF Transcript_28656/g.81969 Transcript_28656/m.81969 type:complete len:210 (+) Transcript_28656:1492-2121(+)
MAEASRWFTPSLMALPSFSGSELCARFLVGFDDVDDRVEGNCSICSFLRTCQAFDSAISCFISAYLASARICTLRQAFSIHRGLLSASIAWKWRIFSKAFFSRAFCFSLNSCSTMVARASKSWSILLARSHVHLVKLSVSVAVADLPSEDEDEKHDFRDLVDEGADCCTACSSREGSEGISRRITPPCSERRTRSSQWFRPGLRSSALE